MFSYIYIITDGKAFKVGISKEPQKRLRELQTGNASKLEILHLFKVPEDKVFKLEKDCHRILTTNFVKRGEWFHGATDFSVRIIVDEVCEKYLISD
jgi:hypothetical protein